MKHVKPLVHVTEIDHSVLEWVPESRTSKEARQRSLERAAQDHSAMLGTLKVDLSPPQLTWAEVRAKQMLDYRTLAHLIDLCKEQQS